MTKVQKVPVKIPQIKLKTRHKEVQEPKESVPQSGLEFLLETFKKCLVLVRSTPKPIYAGVCEFTPDIAEEILLKYHSRNRPLKKRVMETYQRDVESGHWAVTGETIIFDENGQLIQGQHRLNGGMLAKRPFQSMVVVGVAAEVFKYLDQGEKRRPYDVFALTGEKNTKNLQAVLRQVWHYENSELGSSKQYPSIASLEEILRAHSNIREFVATAPPVPGIPPSIIGALSYLFDQADSKRAKEFFARLSDGTGLVIDSPVRALRETVRSVEHMTSRAKLAITILAWNQYVQDKPLRRVKWDASQAFPKIVGLQVEAGEEGQAGFDRSMAEAKRKIKEGRVSGD